MSRKRITHTIKTVKIGSANEVKHIYHALGGSKKLPAAAYEGCVLVPFHLASFIPESAIRKFAANKLFVVDINGLGEERLSFYGRHRNLLPLKNVYRITLDANPAKSR